jgi:hypothetical protein
MGAQGLLSYPICKRRRTFRDSDVHGYENPCGFAGTGVTGTGTGDEIFTRDLPVPVWAGDGSVTRSPVTYNITVQPPTPPPQHTIEGERDIAGTTGAPQYFVLEIFTTNNVNR